ncbi:hypothetical protein Tsp_10778 [Trichinella spiralis]|uniref:hypothetical protein n=1 Tax=Trichinella spiralis TaxID=6334 RepID=UPI0001EFD4EE|nr:hypothetical protein Tsp_10778 [Trichinella spiralis]
MVIFSTVIKINTAATDYDLIKSDALPRKLNQKKNMKKAKQRLKLHVWLIIEPACQRRQINYAHGNSRSFSFNHILHCKVMPNETSELITSSQTATSPQVLTFSLFFSSLCKAIYRTLSKIALVKDKRR